jgi:hypothetical protein
MQRGLNKSIDVVDVRFLVQIWRDSTMHAKVVSIYVSSYWQGIKRLNEKLVDLLFELLKDFQPKSKVFRHRTTFVIASDHDDALGIVQLYEVSKLGLTLRQ